MRYLIVSICVLLFFRIGAQDMEPPVITVQPQDESLTCETDDLILLLSDWYNNAGGMMATDNSGMVSFSSDVSLSEAIQVFQDSQDTLCGLTKSITLVFIASDPSGNETVSEEATFMTFDNTPPQIFSTAPPVEANCFPGIQDSLVSWIENFGYATILDNCSFGITGDIFLWSITGVPGGNTGVFGVGPYPEVPDSTCNWELNFTFRVLDDCGNQRSTNASFTIIDTLAPQFLTEPKDTTISCDMLFPADTLMIVDNCDSGAFVEFMETDTQGADSTLCEYYNYEIERRWVAFDACDNTDTVVQTIFVRDNTPPIFSLPDTIEIDCQQLEPFDPDVFFTSYQDNCSETMISFTDNVDANTCGSMIERRYRISDVCENDFVVNQIVIVEDLSGPTFDIEPQSLEITCDSGLDFRANYSNWVNGLDAITVSDSCSEAKKFVAISGSYTLGDTSTYSGTFPFLFPDYECSIDSGFLLNHEVDVVAYDDCGNHTVRNLHFGIIDTIPPQINCPSPQTFDAMDNCEFEVTLPEISVNDNCSESASPIVRTQQLIVESDIPGDNELPVNTMIFKIGPFFADGINANGDVELTIELNNLDADDATEFFTILDEDNNQIGVTPNTSIQCGDTSLVITTISNTQINDWIQDGFIDFIFQPNIPMDFGSLAINDVCSGSSIRCSISFDAEISNIVEGHVIFDGDTLDYIDAINQTFTLGIGEHSFMYQFSDCALNLSTCEYLVTVNDLQPPIINCPDSFRDTLSIDSCYFNLAMLSGAEVSDNCGLSKTYSEIQPVSISDKLLTFEFVDSLGSFVAQNKIIEFTGVFPIHKSLGEPNLKITLTGDLNSSGEVFTILDEDGLVLGTSVVAADSCSLTSNEINIPIESFNEWVADGVLQLVLQAPRSNSVEGGGINPCLDLNMDGVDGFSAIDVELSYNDAQIFFSTTGAIDIDLTPIDQVTDSLKVRLPVGTMQISYFVTDLAQNEASCNFEVEIVDIQEPEALCKNTSIQIHPSGLDDYILLPDSINNGSYDNCEIINYSISPDTFKCENVGEQITVFLTVEDANSNTATCESLVRVDQYQLEPSYIAGICPGDSLQLFANIPESQGNPSYNIEWFMNGVLFSNEENPVIPDFSGGSGINFSIIVTGFNMCRAEGSVIVTHQPLDAPELTIEKASGCIGEDILLQSTAYTGDIMYRWFEGMFPNGVLIDSTLVPSLTISPSSEGTTFYYVVAQNDICDSEPSNVRSFTAFEKPQVSVDNPFVTVCEGGEIILSTSVTGANYQYEWIGPGFSSDMQLPPPIMDVNENNAGNYNLVINVGLCLSDTATSIVNVEPRPETPVLSGEEIYCEGNNLSLSVPNVPNADTYEWYLDGVSFKVTNTNVLNQIANQGLSGDWTVIAKVGDCESLVSEVKQVVVEDRIEVGASNTGPVCIGDSIELKATFIPNASYIWEGPNISDVVGQEIKVLAEAGDYTVTVSTVSGCDNIGTTTVEVNSPPQVTALSNNSLDCMDGMTDITFEPTIFPMSNNYTYEWIGPNFSSDQAMATIVDATEDNNGKYTLIVYNNGCPSDSISNFIDIQTFPEAPSIIGNTSICIGDSLILTTAINADDVTYFWNTPKGLLETTEDSLIIEVSELSDAGVYELIIEEGSCPSQDTSSIEIDIKSLPDIPTIVGETDLCYGSDEVLKITDLQDGDVLLWDTPQGETIADSLLLEGVDETVEGEYTVTLTRDGCRSEKSVPFSILVREEIITPVFEEDEVFVCLGEEDNVIICLDNQSLTSGAQYVLFADNGDFVDLTISNCFEISDGSILSEGINIFRALTKIDGCESDLSSSVIVNIQSAPTLLAMAESESDIVCQNDDLVLLNANEGPPNTDIEWKSLTPGLQFSNPNIQNTSVTNFNVGENVIVLNYSKDGCIDFSSDTLRILLEETPDVNDDSYSLSYGQSVTLNVEDNDAALPLDYSINFDFDDEDGKLLINESETIFVPDLKITGDIFLEYEICAVECPDLCDEGNITINVSYEDACIVPSIITPNRDGINDYFVIPCLNSGFFPDNEVKIFNQWGDEVFSASPYENDWEGTYAGDELPVGTYYYIVDVGNEREIMTGFVVIKR